MIPLLRRMAPVWLFSVCVFIAVSNIAFGQEISQQCGGRSADIVFVVDASRSIWEPYFVDQLNFIRDVVQQFDIEGNLTRVAIITFGDRVQPEFQLNTYMTKEAVLTAIGNIRFMAGSRTNTFDAIQYMRETSFSSANGARTGIAHIGIVLTDGVSANTVRTIEQATQAKAHGITMFAIGIGTSVNVDELRGIASSPSSNYTFEVNGFRALTSIKTLLAYEACQVTVAAETPITATTATSTIVTSPPRTTPPPTISVPTSTERMQQDMTDILNKSCGGKPADIVFIMDKSSSIWAVDFTKQLQFVSNVVGIFDIAPDRTRIAVMTFSDRPQIEFNFTMYADTEAIQTAISAIQHTGGVTETADAIEMMTLQLFGPSHGSRPDVAHIAVLLTDGLSRYPDITIRRAEEAKRRGIYIFTIGIGDEPDVTELNDIASDPDTDYVFQVGSFDALDTIRQLLALKTCAVNLQTHPEGCGFPLGADIIFGLELSQSAAGQKETVYQFVSNLTDEYIVGPSNIQVGLMSSTCPGAREFHLNEYTNKSTLMSELGAGTSQTEEASGLIRDIRQQRFVATNGGRLDAKDILVLILTAPIADVTAAISEARRAKFRNVEIFVVTVGQVTDRSNLVAIASEAAGDHLFSVSSVDDLYAIRESLNSKICSDL